MSDQAPDPAMMAAIQAALRKFNTQLWTFYAIGVVVTTLRTYARIKSVGIKNLRPDDFIVWIAILLYTTQSTLAYYAVNYGRGLANNAMTDAQRAALSPDSLEYELRVFGSKIQVVGWTCYVCLIATLKLAILFFYVRLMEGLSSHFRIRIWIGFGLLGATFLASILSIYAPCQPLSRYWQINPNSGNLCHAADSRSIIWTTFASSVVTDIYLIMIPLPMLWGTKLRLAKKIGASFVLGAGVFVLLCSLLKTVFVITDPINGAQLAGEWGTREAFASVVTTNLPMLFPLLRSWFKPIFGSRLNSTRSNSKHPSGFRTIGGGDGLGGNSGSKRQGGASAGGSKHNKTTETTLTYCESEESIVRGGSAVQMRDLGAEEAGGKGPVADGKAILVQSEFHVVDDGEVGRGPEASGKSYGPEAWTNLGSQTGRAR